VQIRLLLGDRFDMSRETIARDAARATGQFLALYGAKGRGVTLAGKDNANQREG
jgi:hypothetical protein